MIDQQRATFAQRRQLRRAVVLGASVGVGCGVIVAVALTFFPAILQLTPNPSGTTVLASLPWAGGLAVVVGAVGGVVTWLRRPQVAGGGAIGGTLVLPGMVELAINGTTVLNPEQNWGIFVDVSNIALGEHNAVDLSAGEMERALDWLERTHGRMLVRHAYGDFSSAMQRAADIALELRRRGFTLTHMPRLTRGGEKNHSDIQMAVDAALIGRARPDIGGFIIMGGDSDFTPLVLQLRSLGKRIFVVGREHTTSAALLSYADGYAFMEAISGRDKLAPSALRTAVATLRKALTGLASQGIAVPAITLPALLKTLGIDVTALGFGDVVLFQRVVVALGLLRKANVANDELIMPGEVTPGDDALDKLLRALGVTMAEFAKRNRRPTLSQVLDDIWEADPTLDVTKTTPLVRLNILNIAERLNIIGTERKPGEETKLIAGKLLI